MRRPHIVFAALFIVTLSFPARDAAGWQGAAPPAPQVHVPGKDGVSAPKLIKEVKPKYTGDAMRAGIEGLVLMSATLMTNGRIGEITVTRSLDSRFGLDAEAVRVVKQWRFAPGMKDGSAVLCLRASRSGPVSVLAAGAWAR